MLQIQALTSCATLAQSFQLQFPQLQSEITPAPTSWDLYEDQMHVQHLAQYVAHGKNVSHYYSDSAAVVTSSSNYLLRCFQVIKVEMVLLN